MSEPEYSKVEEQLLAWASEAFELRHGEASDPDGKLHSVDPNDGVQALNHMLLRVRQRSDRVEFILGRVTQSRYRIRRSRDAAKFEAEVAYDTAADTNAKARVREFVSREERHAEAALESLQQRREAHLAERRQSIADEAYDVVKQVDWQLSSMRTDLRASLHALHFESNLER